MFQISTKNKLFPAGWTDWMSRSGFGSDQLKEGLEACRKQLKEQPRALYSYGPTDYSVVTAAHYIYFLQEHGVVTRDPVAPKVTEIWPILGDFRLWSTQHRGTRETTLDLYETTLRDFVKVLGDKPETYTATGIRDFVLMRAKPHSAYRAQAITVACRAFLRYLAITGRCSASLVYSVPSYPNYRLKSAPRFLEATDVKRVLDACVSEDPNGLRDRAVMLLLSRLGLRASDVAGLTFKDVDWKNGRIAVCGKNRRSEWLPLPQDVGDAILRYIQEGRPPLKIDPIFTKVDAPLGPLTRASVTHIARSALKRAGVKAPINGAHVFRHSAATSMLRQGVSLSGVASVLRHHNLDTAGIYAKVDFASLLQIAQPWPEVASC